MNEDFAVAQIQLSQLGDALDVCGITLQELRRGLQAVGECLEIDTVVGCEREPEDVLVVEGAHLTVGENLR